MSCAESCAFELSGSKSGPGNFTVATAGCDRPCGS